MLKKLMIGVVVLVGVAIVGLVIVFFRLNSVVQFGVEKGGTRVLGVDTKLRDADVSPFGGSAAINGLTLGSPEGFDADTMYRMEHARVGLNVWSLTSDDIHIREVVVDAPEMTLEFKGTRMNWTTLMKRLQEGREEEKAGEAKPGKRMRIDRLVFKNARVEVVGLPAKVEGGLSLPNIEMNDLKTADGGGLTPRQLLLKVIPEVIKAAREQLKLELPAGQLDEISGQLQKNLEDLGTGGAAGETIEKGKESIGGAVEGLLGGKKDEDKSD